MATNNTHRKYFQSKINKDFVERFIIEESIIGFNHAEFKERIKDELSYLGMNYDEVEFQPNEIASVKKILGM